MLSFDVTLNNMMLVLSGELCTVITTYQIALDDAAVFKEHNNEQD